MQNQEFIQEFVEEARVHIENVESGLLNISLTNTDLQAINNIFRDVHSMKGTAGFFGLTKIVSLSHAMENILGDLRNSKLQLNQEMIDVLLTSNDCLKSMVEDVNNSEATDVSTFIEKLSILYSPPKSESEQKESDEKVIIIDKENKAIEVTSAQSNMIHEGFKHGNRLYKINLRMCEDIDKNGISPIQFFKKVESIGSIIEASTDTSEIKDLDAFMDSDIHFTFLFMTVLEKSLLPLALNVPENRIMELDNNINPSDFHKIVSSHSIIEEKKPVKTESTFTSQDNSEELLPKKREFPAGPKETPNTETPQKKLQNTVIDDSIRVHVNLLDSILNLASELVLGRNQLMRALDKHRKNIPGIEPILQNIDHITTEMQEKVMQTRMQPISNVFNKFPRIIRDLSKKLNKDIELLLEGSEVELDKSIIEVLGDPITHLVRNSADHGLETPEIRENLGKPRTGTIILKAYHEGGYVNIDVIDDGAGINFDVIKQKALEKELVTKAEYSKLTDQEAVQLLFRPGFSTAEKITDVSGRGVGMDVVKTNIEKLGGTIEVFTSLGAGTTFRLMLPLTLAIISSLIVDVEGQKFALPQVNLHEIVRIKPGDTTRRIEYIHNSEVLRLRDKLLPIVHLSDVLGIARTYTDPVTGERKQDRRQTLYDKRVDSSLPENEYYCRRTDTTSIIRILVLKIGSKRFGIAVNSILGSEEILVKPLPVFLKDCKSYSGVTIMGDGKTAMILDPEGIIEKAGLKFIESKTEQSDKDNLDTLSNLVEQQNLLIFKCSGPETFAVDLSMVSRVDEISSTDIEKIGDKEYINFRGNSLKLVRPENHLPVTRLQNNPSKLYVIIPKLVKHPLGILIEKIQDTVQTKISLNHEDITAKGLTGSTILNGNIILLINIYELFEMAAPEHYSSTANTKNHAGKTVLVAEDTPFFQRMEKSYLEDAGYRVLMAHNGKEALQILQDEKVDAIVSDIHMPVMNGLDLIRRIREDKSLSHIPAIAVTSLTGDQQKQDGLDAGFDFYEFKLDRDKLIEKLDTVLHKRR